MPPVAPVAELPAAITNQLLAANGESVGVVVSPEARFCAVCPRAFNPQANNEPKTGKGSPLIAKTDVDAEKLPQPAAPVITAGTVMLPVEPFPPSQLEELPQL